MTLTDQGDLPESLPPHSRRWQEGVRKKGYTAGPYVRWFIKRVWARAALRACGESVEVLQCVRWYSAEQVEQAIRRAIKSGIEGVEGLRAILEEKREGMRTGHEETGDGQLVFPFMGETPRECKGHGMTLSRSSEKQSSPSRKRRHETTAGGP